MNVMTTDISVEFEDRELESSSIFSKQCFVKLQSPNPQAMVGNINRMLCSDSLLFIVDGRNNKLVSFNYNGDFINSTIDLIGHARNEYVHLLDADIDENLRQIYLYCDNPYQMLILDYDLRVKECVPMNELLLEIAVDSKYLYALYPDLTDGSKYDIRCYEKNDLNGKPKILVEQDKAIPNVRGMGNMLNRSGEFIYACLPFDDDIYKISDGKIIRTWNINIGDRWFDYSRSKGMKGRKFISANLDNDWTIQNVTASESEIIFNTNQPNVFELSIDSNECIAYSGVINETIPFSDSWLISTSGIFDVSFSIPASFIANYRNYYAEKKEPLPDNPLNSIIQSTSSEDNPIIVFANLK